MFIEKLNTIYKKNQIVSLYLERNSDKFVVGYILNYSEEYILFLNLSLTGTRDSIMLIPTYQIMKYEVDGQYERKMELLCQYQNNALDNTDYLRKMKLPEDFYEFLIKKGEYVGIYGEEDTVFGKIQKFMEESMEIESWNLYGQYDGNIVIKTVDIEVLDIESDECKVLDILQKSRKR